MATMKMPAVGVDGGRVASGIQQFGGSEVSVEVGFEPQKIYLYKLADGGTTKVAANSVMLVYDKAYDSSHQYRASVSTTGNSADTFCLPCPTTSYNNCIRSISNSGFVANMPAFQGNYYWVAVG